MFTASAWCRSPAEGGAGYHRAPRLLLSRLRPQLDSPLQERGELSVGGWRGGHRAARTGTVDNCGDRSRRSTMAAPGAIDLGEVGELGHRSDDAAVGRGSPDAVDACVPSRRRSAPRVHGEASRTAPPWSGNRSSSVAAGARGTRTGSSVYSLTSSTTWRGRQGRSAAHQSPRSVGDSLPSAKVALPRRRSSLRVAPTITTDPSCRGGRTTRQSRASPELFPLASPVMLRPGHGSAAHSRHEQRRRRRAVGLAGHGWSPVC